eukprot:TRINITY_DN907_c0_g1_i1.p1 TRINITY_DN907_c0_g1~~TRINITY_DN907_c0_g1_i1.p1  ORF type:complete len:354 (+),score=66.53 TRINITY_DN907_c0_g1_i1:332-1393(+)
MFGSNGAVKTKLKSIVIDKNGNPRKDAQFIGQGQYGRVFRIQRPTEEFLSYSRPKKILKRILSFGKMKIEKETSVIKFVSAQHYESNKSIREFNLLASLNHPFIVKMKSIHVDGDVYGGEMEDLRGGELSILKQFIPFLPEPAALYYVSSIALTLDYLHSKNIIYRDLKPENLVMDEKGFLKMIDFGLSVKVSSPIRGKVGTERFMSPEVYSNSIDYLYGPDWWALGVLLYDLVSETPAEFRFIERRERKTAVMDYKRLYEQKRMLQRPKNISDDCWDCICQFIHPNESERLGVNGIGEIKQHSWFKGIKWEKLEKCEIPPPYKPSELSSDGAIETITRSKWLLNYEKEKICD